MEYQEKFTIVEANESFFANQFDILITGMRQKEDERHSYIRKILKSYRGIVYSFDTCENADKFSYKLEKDNGELIEEIENKSLIPDLHILLKKGGFQGGNICIDI